MDAGCSSAMHPDTAGSPPRMWATKVRMDKTALQAQRGSKLRGDLLVKGHIDFDIPDLACQTLQRIWGWSSGFRMHQQSRSQYIIAIPALFNNWWTQSLPTLALCGLYHGTVSTQSIRFKA